MKNLYLIIISCFYCTLSAQSTIYVRQNANGTGINWQNALSNLNTALNIANYGDTIKVASGTYKPTDDNSRDSSFRLKNGVKLLGAYKGNGINPNERNYTMFPSVLSGDIGIPNVNTDNSYHVVKSIGRLDNTTLIDGFSISYGNANLASDGLRNSGGGLYLHNTQVNEDLLLNISNCIFSHNYAIAGAANSIKNLYFGGICHPKISNCVYEYNSAVFVAGHNVNLLSDENTFTLDSCIFRFNNSGNGTAFWIDPNGIDKIKIQRCSFTKNKSQNGSISSIISFSNNQVKTIEIQKTQISNNNSYSSIVDLTCVDSLQQFSLL
jgi:hypothetical protein